MNSILVILNPKAGKCNGAKKLSEILSILQETNRIPTTLITTQTGDARRFAEKYGGSHELVVCIGGDGTFNEVVSGMLSGCHETPIGYIPAGSTNDFAASLSLSTNIEVAARNIIDGNSKHFDVGSFCGKPFVYVASFGAFTKTSYSASQEMKNVLGYPAYLLEGIKDIPNIHAEPLRIETDYAVFTGDYLFGSISNSTSIGGFLKLDPRIVDYSDGALELFLIRKPSNPLEITQLLQALATHSYDKCDCITMCSSRKIRIYAEHAFPWTLDGEYEDGNTYIDISVRHRAIQVIVPARQAGVDSENSNEADN